MTGKLKIDIKRVIKYAWITTNSSLLLLVIGSYVLYPDYPLGKNDAALVLMLLSFPSSILTVLLTANFMVRSQDPKGTGDYYSPPHKS